MPARVSFNYALIRVVPRVEREEFLNAGVILHCPEQRYLGAAVAFDHARLRLLHPDADLDLIDRHLRLFVPLCAGETAAGPLAAMPLSERFHWAVAPRSTIVQISPVHAGLTEDPAAELAHLLTTLIG